ncbi:unnamed protein product, partial [Mesorhabditis belari]|uniref:Uncharacterized protein n=1 Tax=Mesorhabditis belari TaxID=2138241 RepID=A0AAF3F3M0_9BILA
MAKYTKVEAIELVSQNIRSSTEEEILKRIQNLQKTVVSQVHTHVEDIFRLTDKDILDEKLLFVIAEKGYTRVPIFETNNLMRYILNTRDLLTVPLSPTLTIGKYLSGFDQKPEIRVVLADTPVIVVLIEMLRTQNHMYTVVRCDGPSQLLGYDGSDSVWSKNRRAKPHEDQSVLAWLKEPIGPGEIPQPAKLNLIQMLFSAHPKLKEKGFDLRMAHQAMNSSVLYQTKRDTIVCRKGEIIKRIFVIYVGGLIVDKNNYIAPIIHGIELLKELCETEIYRNREILAVSQNTLLLQKGTVFYWLSPTDLLNQLIFSKKKKIAKEFFIGINSQIKVESLSQTKDFVPAEFESLTNKQHPTQTEILWKECETKEKTFKHFCKQLPDETREWTINEERADDTQFDTEMDSERIQRSNKTSKGVSRAAVSQSGTAVLPIDCSSLLSPTCHSPPKTQESFTQLGETQSREATPQPKQESRVTRGDS